MVSIWHLAQRAELLASPRRLHEFARHDKRHTVVATDTGLWLITEWVTGARVAFRVAFSPRELSVDSIAVDREADSIHVEMSSTIGQQTASIGLDRSDGTISASVTLKPVADLTVAGWPRDVIPDLDHVEGTVEWRASANGEWAVAQQGQVLSQGAEVRTGADSRATLRLTEGSKIYAGPGTEVALVPSGDRFELRVRGPGVTPGYFERADLTLAAFDDDGFFRTGDAGNFVDTEHAEAGLAFVGRIGENFKLASGTWVHVGEVRIAAIAAATPVIADAVVTAPDRNALGLLVVLITGGIDISVSATAVASMYISTVVLLEIGYEGPFVVAALLACHLGGLFGVVNAGLIVGFNTDAPLALVHEDFAPANLLAMLAFAGIVAALYSWLLKRMRR